MWPRAAWAALYEPLIRRAAGLGRAPTEPDPDRYAQRYAHCDVLVVGAGPAGIAAAVAAAECGARVVLCDEQAEPGGSLLDGPAAQHRRRDGGCLARVVPCRNSPGIRACSCCRARPPSATSRTTTSGSSSGSRIIARMPRRARSASGSGSCAPARSCSRPARSSSRSCFRATTVPGSCWRARRTRTSIATACARARAPRSSRRRTARTGPRSIFGPRASRSPRSWISARAARWRTPRGRPASKSSAARRSPARAGSCASAGIELEGRTLACDLVLMSGGWAPSVHLFSQSRGRLTWSDAARAFVPSASAERERSAGACRGVYGLAEALADGAAAGVAAATACGHAGKAPRMAVTGDEQCRTWQRRRAPRRARTRARRPSWISRTT